MSAPVLDILRPIRTAIVNASDIVALLGLYEGEPSVHTRRPIPEGAEFPAIVIERITRNDADGISDYRPRVIVDVNVYGRQDQDYRDVETVAELLYGLFHRELGAISVTSYGVSQIIAQGPYAAPVDDASRVGRRVSLTIGLYAR